MLTFGGDSVPLLNSERTVRAALAGDTHTQEPA
jgi:hypothetical protein